jgi:hypothetical protein
MERAVIRMLNTTSKICLVLAGAVTLFCAGCRKKELEPTPSESIRPPAALRPALQFRPVAGVADAVKEADIMTQSLPQLHSRLLIRTIVVPAGRPVTLTMEHEGLLELRAGSLVSVAENNRQEHRRGEIWQVAKGERVTLQVFGELAVVRAVYLVPGEK